MPYWPDVAGAPQNSIIGGATLWVLKGRPATEYKGVAKFFAYLSRPEVQAWWHQATGYLPITRAAYELTRKQGFYDRNPGTDISIQQITLKPPTENTKGLRLGSFVLIRDVIEDEMEQAIAGKVTAKAALDSAVRSAERDPAAVREGEPVELSGLSRSIAPRAPYNVLTASRERHRRWLGGRQSVGRRGGQHKENNMIRGFMLGAATAVALPRQHPPTPSSRCSGGTR